MGNRVASRAYSLHQRTNRSRTNTSDIPRGKRTVVGAGFAPDMNKIKAGLGSPDGGASAKGLGALGSIVDAINDSTGMPYYNMDVIEQVRWTMLGPQTDESVSKNFGAEIDLFGAGKSPTGIDYVETTMAQTGQTQTYFIACFVGVHMEPEPFCMTIKGNAWTSPTTGMTSPISPDVFTANDVNNGALGAAFVPGEGPAAQVLIPAFLEWGWWANYAFWHMARGYNLRWKIGQHTNIMDEVLRHTAYCPPSAQEGSSSNSEVDVPNLVRRANERYDALGTALTFLKVNRIRLGSVGTGGANFGIFAPSRDEQIEGATYGGMDLRSMLSGNSEFRKLTLPYVIKPGVPIGLVMEENDTAQADIMRQYLSITQGFGGTFPPVITDDANIDGVYDGTGTAPVGLERTLDGLNVAQQQPAGTAIYKHGDAKLSLMIKGFEVSEDWYNVLSNNADLKNVVMSACGIRFATQGS